MSVYHPTALHRLGESLPTLVVRVRGEDAANYAARLRDIAGNVDPALRLNHVGLLASSGGLPRVLLVLGSAVLAVLLAVIGLSTAGTHALMSFTVRASVARTASALRWAHSRAGCSRPSSRATCFRSARAW